MDGQGFVHGGVGSEGGGVARSGGGFVGPCLGVGFATALAMWVLGYITHLPGVSPETTEQKAVVGVAMLVVLGLGLSLGGAAIDGGVRRVLVGGLVSGLVCGLVNLGILGSLISQPPVEGGTTVAPGAGATAGGFLALTMVLGAVSAEVGRRVYRGRGEDGVFSLDLRADGKVWRFRLCVLAAVSVVPVLLTGGLVTSQNAGLAVPDWPNSYTANMFLYPLSKMTGGIYFEHTHRLFGSLAGVGCVVAFGYALWSGARGMVVGSARRGVLLAFVAGVAVLVQGLLGGLRVAVADGSADVSAWKEQARAEVYTGRAHSADYALTVDNATSLNLAAAHGVSGQVTFALLAVIAAMLSPRWLSRSGDSEGSARSDGLLRWSAYVLFGASVVQLSLGSLTRHHESLITLLLHASLGTLVFVVAAMAGFRALSRHRETAVLRRLGGVLIGVVTVQFLLGWGATFFNAPLYDGTRSAEPAMAVLAATAHQAMGALFLANAALLAAWGFRLARLPRPRVAESGSAAAAVARVGGRAEPA